MLSQERGRAAQVLLRVADVESHEQLAGLVGFVRRLSMVEVGRQRREPFRREPIADLLDVAHEAPPLLEDQHAGPLALSGSREEALGRASVAGEFHRSSGHGSLLSLFDCPSPCRMRGASRVRQAGEARAAGPPVLGGAMRTVSTRRSSASSTVIVYRPTYRISLAWGMRWTVASTRPATVSKSSFGRSQSSASFNSATFTRPATR